ncbi:MAG: DnaJ domain-containing protein [Candidatus Eremiobacteraeota bacterium]|nr:DnaJ domain-containing protein [Candidatus Eremiobacteraeota bacterium]
MAVKKDYYKILGVAPVAPHDEIRKAYRMLSKKYHPDLNPHLKTIAEDKMKELVESYNVLNNSNKRKDYDRQPQFQVRRFQKNRRKALSSGDFARKPKFKKEPSLLERLLSPFLKKSDSSGSDTIVDFKQADVHFTLGLSMAEQEVFYEQAKTEFKLSIKFDPKFLESFYNLALMCYKLGEFEEAKVNFQKVLQIGKDDQQARKMIQLLRDDY